MADYRAIATVGRGILRMLEDEHATTDLPKPEFVLAQARDFPAPSAQVTQVVLYLYRVEVSPARRRLPPRLLPDGRKLRPPLAIDLHYLLAPCAESADIQQRLLGWAMRTLEDNPVLPPGLLNSLSQENDIFHEDETVEVVPEALSLQDLTNIFDPVKPNVYLATGYVARMVGLEARQPVSEAAPVQTREFRTGTLERR